MEVDATVVVVSDALVAFFFEVFLSLDAFFEVVAKVSFSGKEKPVEVCFNGYSAS